MVPVFTAVIGGGVSPSAAGGSESLPVSSGAALLSQFTSDSIRIDGIAEEAWDDAKPSPIGIPMSGDLSASAPGCETRGNVRSLWDGALLYVLIDVTDRDVTAAGKNATDKDGVEVYFDLWNDKFPKYEEDDGMIRVSCESELSGSGALADRLKAHAAAFRYDGEKVKVGYTVELAIQIGGVPMRNGSSMGVEFGINDALTTANARKYRVFWSDGNNRGLDDNTRWGDVRLTGHNGKIPMALDSYLLRTNIKKAEAITRGIWVSEAGLEKALAEARSALPAVRQAKIDAGNAALDLAMKALRRSGKYPDPRDLPAVDHLPDPFAFLNGKKVETAADWSARRDEIEDLAQYYEYGAMPKAPEAVTASVNGSTVVVSVRDKGKTASFDAMLFVPTAARRGKTGPYPVIVSIDFRPMKPSAICLNAGYAVLSVIYSSIASDDYGRTGAFYTLYPYDVTTGNDAGTLLAWAWGASRGVDALGYLAKNNPEYANTFDFEKLVVTGFSRCGKAALLAGLMDERFGVVNPGASGCGGAAVYRYDSFGNTPRRTAPFGNVYAWGVSPGCEVLGDRIRHQGHNSNEMLARFLDHDRIYKTGTNGYGGRLPYDHHEIIAAIAPRAVIITTANDDYANGAEGDCIGWEGARPVFQFLGAGQNLALNLRTTCEAGPWGWGGGHWLDDNQIGNLVDFSDRVFDGKPLAEELKAKLDSDPYVPAYDAYYGGMATMMPWLNSVPRADPPKPARGCDRNSGVMNPSN